jgi:hypothetical protein
MKFEINQSIEIELQEDGTYFITLKGCSEKTINGIRQLDMDTYFTSYTVEKMINDYFCDYCKTLIEEDSNCSNSKCEACDSCKKQAMEDIELDGLESFFVIEPGQSNRIDQPRINPLDWISNYPPDEDFGCDGNGVWIEELAIKNRNLPVVEYDGTNDKEYIKYRKSIGDPDMRYQLDMVHFDYNLYDEECGEDWWVVNRMRKLRNIRNLVMGKN